MPDDLRVRYEARRSKSLEQNLLNTGMRFAC